jgi:xanthine dehydrogenase iron-sulfur cluster and FAD-binding subunit A
VVQHGSVSRTLPLEDFFIARRKQDRAAAEFVRDRAEAQA